MTRIRHAWKAGLGLALGVVIGCGADAVARELGAREARDAVSRLLGRPPEEFRIKAVSPGLASGDATVTAQMDVTFQIHKDTAGAWQVSSVRLSGGRWQDVEELRRALDAEKTARARTDLDALATGVEAYRRSRGFLPGADSVAALVDAISPDFQPRVVRVDPWEHPYYYRATPDGFRVGSLGPDGVADTGDDVVVGGAAK